MLATSYRSCTKPWLCGKPTPEQLAPLTPTSPALPQGVTGRRSTTFLAWRWRSTQGLDALDASGQPSNCTLCSPCSPWPHDQRCCPPCLLDKAQRDALHGPPEPALLRDFFFPRKSLSLNTRLRAFSPWVGAHWNAQHQSWERKSACMGSELEWEKGGAERAHASSRFIHLCKRPEHHQHCGQQSEQDALSGRWEVRFSWV